MKVILNEENTYIIRFDKNENVFELLIDHCKSSNINSAYFNGIGAAKEILLSYYDLPTKTYEDHTVIENMEIVSLTGNLSLLDNNSVIHAHGIFAKKDLSTVGGHIKKLVVSATCEIVLHKLIGLVEREKNDEIGLNLLK